MGAAHSQNPPVHLATIMPSKGNKVLKNKFAKELPGPNVSVFQYFQSKILPTLDTGVCGSLVRAAVVLRGGGQEEIEVDELTDEAISYVTLGLSKVLFYVEQPDVLMTAEATPNVNEALRRQTIYELPTWSHAGRPALTALFAKLRESMRKEGLSWRGSTDLKSGLEWMMGLVDVLYKLSPFHQKLKARGHTMPKIFAFSNGADDFKRKGKATPTLTQQLLAEVSLLLPI